MIYSVRHILIPAVLFLLPGSIYPQSIQWETAFDNGETTEVITDLVTTANKDIIAVGYGYPLSDGEPSMLKFDSLGSIKWFKRLRFDTLQNGDFKFIKSIPEKDNFYYTGGNAYELGVWNNDFIAKIDTAGDTLWVKKYHYSTFYGTTKSAVVLKDNSIITTGDLLTASNYDIIARRVDSLGNTLWENIYNIPGVQNGYDLIEMMDGSILIGGSSDGDNLIIRIGFDGSMIDSITIASPIADIDHFDASLYPNNEIIIKNDAWNGNWYTSQILHLNSELNILRNVSSNDWLRSNFNILSDSNLLFTRSPDIDTVYLSTSNLNNGQTNFPLSFLEPRISPLVQKMNGNNIYLAGAETQGGNTNYWLAKISGVGEEWVPDRCAYQPPLAGFEYEYNYPVLTLRDTSSGGLKYLDTVYTWQWNTSVGTSGTDDSLLVFFDTAVNSTIDIELVIGNWYGCTDTVNQTLVLGETGLEVYKELDVKVFPNPVKDILNVHIAEVQDKVLFSLYDLQGRLQFNQVLEKDKTTISLSGLPQGLYIYDIRSDRQTSRGKVIKN